MNYFVLLFPFILFFGLFFLSGQKIAWRNFLALAVFFSAFPVYIFTNKIYLTVIPIILCFLLLNNDWTFRG